MSLECDVVAKTATREGIELALFAALQRKGLQRSRLGVEVVIADPQGIGRRVRQYTQHEGEITPLLPNPSLGVRLARFRAINAPGAAAPDIECTVRRRPQAFRKDLLVVDHNVGWCRGERPHAERKGHAAPYDQLGVSHGIPRS